jgi:hypothetical protein
MNVVNSALCRKYPDMIACQVLVGYAAHVRTHPVHHPLPGRRRPLGHPGHLPSCRLRPCRAPHGSHRPHRCRRNRVAVETDALALVFSLTRAACLALCVFVARRGDQKTAVLEIVFLNGSGVGGGTTGMGCVDDWARGWRDAGAMPAREELCLFPDAATKRSEATAVRTVRTSRDPQRQRLCKRARATAGAGWIQVDKRGWTAGVLLVNSTRTGIVAVAGFCCLSPCRRFLLFVDCEARACCRIRRRSQDGSSNAWIAAGVEGRAAARSRAHTSTLSFSSPLDQSRPSPIHRDVLATHACR